MWVSLAPRLARTPFLWSGGRGVGGLMRDHLIAKHGRMSGIGGWLPRGKVRPYFSPKRGDTTVVSGFLGSRVLHSQMWLMAGWHPRHAPGGLERLASHQARLLRAHCLSAAWSSAGNAQAQVQDPAIKRLRCA